SAAPQRHHVPSPPQPRLRIAEEGTRPVCQPDVTAWIASPPVGPQTHDLLWGVPTGLQNTTVEELRDLWRRIEGHGFDWISIWDHFYAADLGGTTCLEAGAAHTALALETRGGRVGSLGY